MSLDETTLIHLGNLLGQDGVVFQLQDVSHQPSQELGKISASILEGMAGTSQGLLQ